MKRLRQRLRLWRYRRWETRYLLRYLDGSDRFDVL
ncbi:hypothetical protein MSP7336_04414 [Mycobacterium shimoidei]|uniref:Uncharacterized protein n=1 Tax=Mycobacterium shimoidei TaxID=29313 RepID=A0A375Z4S8_MYCSH|nr:hypothetical protein MSP7336_04414 [Mycobacterium shimoidei]